MERQSDSNIQLPPGFRFHPSDEELIVHYLRKKATSLPIPASIVAEVDLYKYNPWDLPQKALFGDDEWYFFSPRERKYPNGARPNRSAASGYWKATGTDKPILTSCGSQSIGVKKALVFYEGRAPKGMKTNWTMHEYRLLDSMVKPSKQRDSMRLDDWVLCRVRQKGNSPSPPRNICEHQNGSTSEPTGCFPMVLEQYCSKIMDPMLVSNYIDNDCPLLAYLLATQDAPWLETSSTTTTTTVSFQGGNNISSAPKEMFDVETLLVADSSSDRLFYNGKPSNKYYEKNNINTDQMSYYPHHHEPMQENNLNPTVSANPGIEFEALNKFNFMGGNSRLQPSRGLHF